MGHHAKRIVLKNIISPLCAIPWLLSSLYRSKMLEYISFPLYISIWHTTSFFASHLYIRWCSDAVQSFGLHLPCCKYCIGAVVCVPQVMGLYQYWQITDWRGRRWVFHIIKRLTVYLQWHQTMMTVGLLINRTTRHAKHWSLCLVMPLVVTLVWHSLSCQSRETSWATRLHELPCLRAVTRQPQALTSIDGQEYSFSPWSLLLVCVCSTFLHWCKYAGKRETSQSAHGYW